LVVDGEGGDDLVGGDFAFDLLGGFLDGFVELFF
jgi:hypothetical protein